MAKDRCSRAGSANDANVFRLQTLGAPLNVELHHLTFGQTAKAVRYDCRVVAKHVFAPLLLDETKTLRIVEPLYGTSSHFTHPNEPTNCAARAYPCEHARQGPPFTLPSRRSLVVIRPSDRGDSSGTNSAGEKELLREVVGLGAPGGRSRVIYPINVEINDRGALLPRAELVESRDVIAKVWV